MNFKNTIKTSVAILVLMQASVSLHGCCCFKARRSKETVKAQAEEQPKITCILDVNGFGGYTMQTFYNENGTHWKIKEESSKDKSRMSINFSVLDQSNIWKPVEKTSELVARHTDLQAIALNYLSKRNIHGKSVVFEIQGEKIAEVKPQS